MSCYFNRTILLCFFTVLFSLAATSQVSRSRAAGGITVDGSDAEWEQPLAFYDPASLLMFGLANDSTHLYLCIKTTDRENQVKIMRGGMKVTFQLGRKREAAVTYPLPLANDPLPGVDERAQQADHARLKKTFFQSHNLLRLEGFVSYRGPIRTENNDTPIQPVISWDSTGAMVYEVSIPLEEIFGKSQAAPAYKKPFLLQIEVNALADYNNEQKKGKPRIAISTSVGGNFSGGMGTGLGVGFGGIPGGMGSPGDKRSFMFRNSLIEQKFTLNL
jgi:hypothetical protein